MNKQQLHEKLEQLHSELQQVDLVNQDERALLQKIRQDIQDLLDKKEGEPKDSYNHLGKQMKEGIEQLEVSHPKVTTLMGQVIDTLAGMGI